MRTLPRLCIVIVSFAITACETAKPIKFSGIDSFQADLAERTTKAVGGSMDFLVVVSQANFPIGTLFHPNSTRPIDYTACLPGTKVLEVNMYNLFPSYSLKKGLAIDAGLDNGVIKELVDFGIVIKDDDNITYSIDRSTLQVLSDTDVIKLSSKLDCQETIQRQKVWLLRGYVNGQRNFSIKSEKANALKGKIQKIASFDIRPGSSTETISIKDQEPIGFLQIISEIEVLPNMAAGRTAASGNKPANANVGITAPTAASSAAIAGKVFVHQARGDTTGKADLVLKTLATASFPVVREIEKIDASRVPRNPQVRYFNESDKAAAERALTEVRKEYSNASTMRIDMPAPKGQLEVWLPPRGQ